MVSFWGGVDLSLSDVVKSWLRLQQASDWTPHPYWMCPRSDVVMSWLRLHQASDWIPHPYWMYTKCFRSLRWCEWPYEFTLTLIGLCRWGADFGFLGVDLSPSDVVMSWLRLQEASDCIRHPYWMYTKCFGIWVSILTLLGLCRVGIWFLFFGGRSELE